MFVEYKSVIEENEILLYSCTKQDILPKDFKAYYEVYYFKFISDAMVEKKIYPTMQHSLSCFDFKELVSMKPPKPRKGITTTKPSVANFVKLSAKVDDNKLDEEVINYLNIKHAASDFALPAKAMVKMSSLQNINQTTIADIDVASWYKSLDCVTPSAKASVTPSVNLSATPSSKASVTPSANSLFEQFVKAYNVTPSDKVTVTPSTFIPLHLRPPIVIGNKVKVGLVQRICNRIKLPASIIPSVNGSVAPSAKASVTPSANTLFQQFAQAYNVTPSAKATVTPSTFVPLHLRPPIAIGNKMKVGLVQRICKRIQSVFTFRRRSN